MEVNRNCIFLFFSFFLLFTLFGATQARIRSLQSAYAINDSGREINLATNFTQIDKLADENKIGHESMMRALLESTKTSKKKSVSKKDKKKKKKRKTNAATTSRGNPSLALLFSTSMLGFIALKAC